MRAKCRKIKGQTNTICFHISENVAHQVNLEAVKPDFPLSFSELNYFYFFFWCRHSQEVTIDIAASHLAADAAVATALSELRACGHRRENEEEERGRYSLFSFFFQCFASCFGKCCLETYLLLSDLCGSDGKAPILQDGGPFISNEFVHPA